VGGAGGVTRQTLGVAGWHQRGPIIVHGRGPLGSAEQRGAVSEQVLIELRIRRLSTEHVPGRAYASAVVQFEHDDPEWILEEYGHRRHRCLPSAGSIVLRWTTDRRTGRPETGRRQAAAPRLPTGQCFRAR